MSNGWLVIGSHCRYLQGKMEEIVKPYNPLFYRRYVDDIITKRSVGKVDYLYSKLNNYHPNLKLTAVANLKEFLDTSIISTDGIISTKYFTKKNKLPTPWLSKRYKRNAIMGELHRASKIASSFDKEVLRIKKKFLSALVSRLSNSLHLFSG